MSEKSKTPTRPVIAPVAEKPQGSSRPVEVPDVAPLITNMDDHTPAREIVQTKD